MAITEMNFFSGGASGMTEVWTNSAPTSDFAAQTISIPNVSSYKYFMIFQKYSTTDTQNPIKIGGMSVDDSITTIKIEFSANTNRTYTLSSSGIDVSAPSGGDPNKYSIPLKILAC